MPPMVLVVIRQEGPRRAVDVSFYSVYHLLSWRPKYKREGGQGVGNKLTHDISSDKAMAISRHPRPYAHT